MNVATFIQGVLNEYGHFHIAVLFDMFSIPYITHFINASDTTQA